MEGEKENTMSDTNAENRAEIMEHSGLDDDKPSTSQEGMENTAPQLSAPTPTTAPPQAQPQSAPEIDQAALRRLVRAVEAMQKPLTEMAQLDLSYQASMREVEALQKKLKELDLDKTTRKEVDEIFDAMENELYTAQHIASWKTAVLYEANVNVQKLIGRQTEPEQNKQQTAKQKTSRAKRPATLSRDSIRRAEREIAESMVARGKGKDSPPEASGASAPEQGQGIPSRRKKPKGPEPSEGRPVQKKRGAGRPRLSRKGDKSKLIYCLCRQVSYGEMVCCDNKKCDEWFHFPCVQLKLKPRGKWYCPRCRGDRCDVINPDLEDDD